jgi:hypothetical protein
MTGFNSRTGSANRLDSNLSFGTCEGQCFMAQFRIGPGSQLR